MSAIQMMGWPMVTIRFNAPATDQDARDWLHELSGLLDRKEPFSMVIHAQPNSEFSPVARKLLGLWFKEKRELLGLYCTGVARLVGSEQEGDRVVSKNMQSAMPFPMKACLDWSEAKDWAMTRIQDNKKIT
ncbi:MULTISPECIES: hypothetical protein [Gammaproteobacteria]|uniref:hypothetical protein n=1 Tax=Gammaproteobacteria TaxID=1236 RepID=UPI001ADAE106|nr:MULTISPECIES: hypothetical protein [Gammaproteobacteria]MBO9480379.1 hypothetical protein [Salinisphaera sp. G21_0]MBO9493699.1 hypothetical protein [Thalassotalea sp. G20_0]